MKIDDKRDLQSIAINHSADINYKDFMKIYRKSIYSFLTIAAKLLGNISLRF